MKTGTKKNRVVAGENPITALVANQAGEIFELEGYGAVGMAGSRMIPLQKSHTLTLPHGSELMFLPDRFPILFNRSTKTLEMLMENPFEPGAPVFPVAAFNSPALSMPMCRLTGKCRRLRTFLFFPMGLWGGLAVLEALFFKWIENRGRI